jgi:hypothetical protein
MIWASPPLGLPLGEVRKLGCRNGSPIGGRAFGYITKKIASRCLMQKYGG